MPHPSSYFRVCVCVCDAQDSPIACPNCEVQHPKGLHVISKTMTSEFLRLAGRPTSTAMHSSLIPRRSGVPKEGRCQNGCITLPSLSQTAFMPPLSPNTHL